MKKDIDISSHPSSEVLAKFVEGTLNESDKATITKHLIECDECSDAVALVMKYGKAEKKTPLTNESKNEQKVVNNIFYKGLGVALVASIVLFLVMPTQEDRPFIEFYIDNQPTAFKAPVTIEIKDTKRANQEINSFLKELIDSTDVSYLKEFTQAQKKLKQEAFDEARELYQKALNRVEDSALDKREKERESIVITYEILLLSLAEGDDESANEYKEVLKGSVRHFRKRWLEDKTK